MNDENMLISYGKNLLKSLLEDNMFVDALFKTLGEKNSNFLTNRIEYLNSEIEKMKDFQHKMNYLISDDCKFVHIRNFISFFFTRVDPALVDTNIKIFLDYVEEKSSENIYETLLDKVCLLNKEALEILKKIKTNINEDNHYEWKEFITLYPNIDNKIRYREILTSNEQTIEMHEVSFGMKNLLDNGFIISLSTNYPGAIDIYNIDAFSLTTIGHLILNYI